jgi:cytoskeletal protein RodZ
MAEIGATLREARMRARIDVSEIEAQTKIRAKYLRALENEEWDLLPGPTFVKSFLRTYADALGLDSKALLEQYRLSNEHLSETEMQPIMPRSRRERDRGGKARPGGGGWFVALVGVFLLIIVLAVIGIASGGSPSGSKSNASTSTPPATTHHPHHHHATTTTASTRPGVVELRLKATAPVWVCLLAKGNRTLINGVILTPSMAEQTYRSSRFAMTLGNSSVAMKLNGQPIDIPPSSQPISFSLSANGRHPLSGSALPHCA